MKLSFLAPAYRHAKYIRAFLDSLAAQTDPDWEAIVVDDASPDGTADIVERFGDDRIKLIRHPFNLGMTAGLNDAFAESTGAIVTFTGTDDILKPDFVAKIKKAFAKDKDVGAAYAPLQTINEDGAETGKMISLPNMPQNELFVEMFLNWNLLPSPGMTVRRDIMATILPLPEGLIMYTDYMMHMKILASSKVAFLPEPTLLYRTSAGGAAGISSKSDATNLREAMETDALMGFIESIVCRNVGLFNHLFRKAGVKADEAAEIPFLIGKLALQSKILEKRKWGARRIMNIMESRDSGIHLHDRFNHTFASYLTITANVAASDRLPAKCRKLRKRSRILSIVSISLLVVSLVLVVSLAFFLMSSTQ